MSHPDRKNLTQESFLGGPSLAAGPEFAQEVKDFLKPMGSSGLLDFAQIWLHAIKGDCCPSWIDLQLYLRPDLLQDTYLLEYMPQEDLHYGRFGGQRIYDRTGIDTTGMVTDTLAEGEQRELWVSVAKYCRDHRAPCLVGFDLTFADKSYVKVWNAIFPMGPDDPPRHHCGFYLWDD